MEHFEYEELTIQCNVPRDERKFHMRDIAAFEVALEAIREAAGNFDFDYLDDFAIGVMMHELERVPS